MTPSVLIGLMLLNTAGAFCIGFAVARLLGRSQRPEALRPEGGVRLTPEDLLGDLELDLARDGNDLETALAGLASDGEFLPSPHGPVSHLRKASRFSERRLAREHQRLVRLAEAAPGASGIAEEIGRHRDRAGELCSLLEGATSEETVDSLRNAIAEFASHNRRLGRELEEARGRLAVRETELLEAQREARIDPLTKIANRRSFEERLAECHTRLGRGDEGYAVILFDVDRFKELNDRFGHSAGDAALCVFAKILKDTVRSYDLPARYGGEEFALLLSGAALDAGKAVAERCRERAEQAVVRHGRDQVTFTVSAGVAGGRAGRTPKETVARADEALYAAKVTGRNCVVTEEALPAPLVSVGQALRPPG